MSATFQGAGQGGQEGLHLPVHDDGVDAFLTAEMFVHHRFGHLGTRSDLFHRGGVESLLREQGASHIQQLLSPLPPRHPDASRAAGWLDHTAPPHVTWVTWDKQDRKSTRLNS